MADVKFVHEKKIIGKFFEAISLDTGMIVFGIDDTMKALELENLETIILFEDIQVTRYEIRNPQTGDTRIFFLNATQEQDEKYFKDNETGVDLEVVS